MISCLIEKIQPRACFIAYKILISFIGKLAILVQYFSFTEFMYLSLSCVPLNYVYHPTGFFIKELNEFLTHAQYILYKSHVFNFLKTTYILTNQLLFLLFIISLTFSFAFHYNFEIEIDFMGFLLF